MIKSLFILLALTGFEFSTALAGGALCPKNSVDGCQNVPVNSGCERPDGSLGNCRLTPLTAGGFCMCYPDDRNDEDLYGAVGEVQLDGTKP